MAGSFCKSAAAVDSGAAAGLMDLMPLGFYDGVGLRVRLQVFGFRA